MSYRNAIQTQWINTKEARQKSVSVTYLKLFKTIQEKSRLNIFITQWYVKKESQEPTWNNSQWWPKIDNFEYQ